jgi:tetratricopeptide (TPR) repeat protein
MCNVFFLNFLALAICLLVITNAMQSITAAEENGTGSAEQIASPKTEGTNGAVQTTTTPNPTPTTTTSPPLVPVPVPTTTTPTSAPAATSKTKSATMQELFRSAYEHSQEGNWSAADEELRETIARQPNCGLCHLDRAYTLIGMQRLDDALAETDLAQKFMPNVPEVMLQKGVVLERQGKLAAAIDQFQKFITDFPKHKDVIIYQSKIKLLKKELTQQQTVAQTGANPATADDYFAFISLDGIKKWKPERFPLKVYLMPEETASKIPGYETDYGKALKQAFLDWQKQSNETVSFSFVDKPSEADIDCRWTNDANKLVNRAEGGEAHLTGSYKKGEDHARILLMTGYKGDGIYKNPPAGAMHAVALHEIGHALGLNGHSTIPGDIMFLSSGPMDREKQLSSRDLKTLAHLYRADVQPVPTLQDKVAMINDEGMDFAHDSNWAEALKKFQQALDLDQNCQPARRNVVIACKSLATAAVKDDRLEESNSYIKRALALLGTNEDRVMRTYLLQLSVAVNHRLNHPDAVQSAQLALQKLKNQK